MPGTRTTRSRRWAVIGCTVAALSVVISFATQARSARREATRWREEAARCREEIDSLRRRNAARAEAEVAERAERNHRGETLALSLDRREGTADLIAAATGAIEILTADPSEKARALVADCQVRRAAALEKCGRLREAIGDLDAVLTRRKGEPALAIHRDRARCERALGRFREAAEDHDAAALLASPDERCLDQLAAAEARALAGELAQARAEALALEREVVRRGVAACERLVRIFELHSQRYGQDRAVGRTNDERVLWALTRALAQAEETDPAVRRRLHERRARVRTRLYRWADAAADWERVVALSDPKSEAGRLAWSRENWAQTLINADEPEAAARALEPIEPSGDVPAGALYSLAVTWARIAGAGGVATALRDRAADRSLEWLTEQARRTGSLPEATLDYVRGSAAFAPVRARPGYEGWRRLATGQ